jgi:hypothetical protein
MTLKGEVTLEWADGEFLFALKSAQIEELQHVCGNVGFGVIYQRLQLGAWSLGDIQHTIRLALIGGGMDPILARRKVDMYAKPPLVAGPNNPEKLARAIVQAAMHGLETLETSSPGEAAPGTDPAGSTSQNTDPVSLNSEPTPDP